MITPLSDDEEVLFRHVHPSFIDNEVLSSQPFAPTSKDNDQLSVDRSFLTDARSSYELFVAGGSNSVGVAGLTVGEFKAEDLSCFPDPIGGEGDPLANLAHAYADYSSHSRSQQKLRAKRLKNKAVARGWLYRPRGT